MKRFSMAMTWLALAGLMTTVSCRKPVVGFTNGEARTVTVSAVTENGDGSKTSIDGLYVKWSEGDEISMNGCRLTLEEGVGGTMGRFTGDVTGDGPYLIGYPFGKTKYDNGTLKLTMSPTLTYDTEKEIVPMAAYAEKVGDDVQFRNAVNMLKLRLKGDGTAASKLTSIVLTSATSNLSGDINVTFNGGVPEFAAIAGDGASRTMTVSFGEEGLQLKADEVKCVYIPLAKIAAGEVLTVRFVCAAGEMKEKVTATSYFNAVNNMLDCGVVEVKAAPGFSVDASGTKVEFAPGNLQYLGKSDGTGTWRFAEHQWDYMGAGPSATSNRGNVDLSSLGYSTYNTGSGKAGPNETEADKTAARDLFGWGCTGFQDMRKDNHTDWYQTNYMPYSTSTSTVNTTYNYYGYGPDYYDASKYGLSVENKSDWGCVTGLPSAGEGKRWRTLSSAEWAYLFNTRTVNGGKGEGKSWRRATINSDASDGSMVYGILLYPDGYTAQTEATSYTTEQWSAMESAGVVFLPAAGYRVGTSLDDVGSFGDYWSSSCIGSCCAYDIYFYSGGVNPQYDNSRCNGLSVRLVR